ncbi:MAG TPA: hypothetical protein VIA18_04705 [Polyangia bacterium]|nr:hypothetical protein [Polyangia bacterium]
MLFWSEMSQPEMRSSLMKEALRAIDELGEPGPAIRAVAGSETIAVIERSSRVDWLPVELMLKVLEATRLTLGLDVAVAHWRRGTMRVFETPLVKPFASGAISLFHPSPSTALPLFPKLNKLLYRNTGTVAVVSVDDSTSQIVHDEVPLVMRACKAWAPSLGASYVATLDFLRASQPKLDVLVEGMRVTFTLHWKV